MLMNQRPLFRRLALALAAAQIVVYAAAPVLEALTERAPGPVALERSHSSACVVLHAPDSCLACQLLSALGQAARGTCLPVALSDAVSPATSEHSAWTPRAPPRNSRSRAPPQHLA
jgi:hypothetical protein